VGPPGRVRVRVREEGGGGRRRRGGGISLYLYPSSLSRHQRNE